VSVARVYGLAAADSKINYVGQTTRQLQERLAQHKRAAVAGKSTDPVHEWMRAVGPQEVKIILLEECPAEDRYRREDHWISALGTVKTGTNRRTTYGSRGKTTVPPPTKGRMSAQERKNIAVGVQRTSHLRRHVARGYVSPECPLCGL
jgi:hypothetical protein